MSEALVTTQPEIGSIRLIPSTRAALAEAETIPELRHIADGARLYAAYARTALKSRVVQNEWAEVRLDAQRKGGGVLRRMGEAGERRERGGESADITARNIPRLVDLGVAESTNLANVTAHRWQQLALIPDEPWAQWKADQRANDKDFTEAAALQFAKRFQEWTERERDLFERLMAGETVVVSFRTDANLIEWAETEAKFVRIDRRSDWGNPFLMDDEGEVLDGDRATVIAHYEQHYLPFKPSLLNRMHDLKAKVLGCWCDPAPCHGHVLKRWVERLDGGRDENAREDPAGAAPEPGVANHPAG